MLSEGPLGRHYWVDGLLKTVSLLTVTVRFVLMRKDIVLGVPFFTVTVRSEELFSFHPSSIN